MRDNDDDVPGDGTAGGSLAEGLGETVDSDGNLSTADSYGADSYGEDSYGDDSYGEDSYGDDNYGDDTYGDDGGTSGDGGLDPSGETDPGGTAPEDGTFGDGEGDLPADDGDAGDAEVAEDEADTTVDGVLDGAGLPAESGSPLEGIGYLLDELHGALFGGDDDAGLGDAAAGTLDPDAAELETDTDLDLTGDGVVDGADLHEARSVLDFDVD